MTDPGAAIQKAIYAALRADELLTGWFAARPASASKPRVYDHIPADRQTGKPSPSYPYLHIGEADDQALDDSDDCHDIAETFFTVHIWSRAIGSIEAKELAAHVVRVLDAPIAIEGHGVISHRIEKSQGVGNPDGLTNHRVVTVVYSTSPV